MCSVVIIRMDDQLVVTMNRDERRDRAPETPPVTWPNGMQAPRDEAAAGTWIGVMPHGAWACLLNSYEVTKDQPQAISRGAIIPYILGADDPVLALQALDKTPYKPFRLLLGDAEGGLQQSHWDGQDFRQQQMTAMPFFTSSSSWQATEVLQQRKDVFDEWAAAGMPQDKLGRPLINLWREANEPRTGILMQRPETHTTSITQIRLKPLHNPAMQYWRADDVLPVSQSAFAIMSTNRQSLRA